MDGSVLLANKITGKPNRLDQLVNTFIRNGSQRKTKNNKIEATINLILRNFLIKLITSQ